MSKEHRAEGLEQNGEKTVFSFLQLIPFIIIVVYVVAIFFIKGRLPTPADLLNTIKDWYVLYGNYLVFFASLLEGIFLLGLYVPGSTVILFGAALSKSGAIGLPSVLLFATLGLLLGYVINYFLGKYGWYHVLAKFGMDKGLLEAQKKLEKHGGKAIFVGYIFPNGGAFLSTAAGVMKMPFGKFFFYSLLAQTFWILIWGSVAYFIGPVFVDIFMKYFGYMILGIIAIYILRKYILERTKRSRA